MLCIVCGILTETAAPDTIEEIDAKYKVRYSVSSSVLPANVRNLVIEYFDTQMLKFYPKTPG